MAAEEQLLNLLDSYWFHHEIFSSKPACISVPPSEPIPEADQEQQHNEKEEENPEVSEVKLFRIRSLSDRCLRCISGFSPDSADHDQSLDRSPKSVIPSQGAKKARMRKRNMRRKKGVISRSLSELEYQELKGFMDMGFVFSEEDKTSSLASILPGLQKWSQNKVSDDHDHPIKSMKNGVSRPYLSEAWDGSRKKAKKPMIVNWKFPPTCNKSIMKLHLKAWAHIVASSVRVE